MALPLPVMGFVFLAWLTPVIMESQENIVWGYNPGDIQEKICYSTKMQHYK